MTCLIVEDEEFSIQHIEALIDKVPFLELKHSFTDPNEAILYLQQNPVDLIFLDIEMPNYAINGIDFIRIAGHNQKYVLTTAYSEYALQGYELDVVDFLHKPFSFERFLKSVQKVQQLLERSEKLTPADNDLFIYVKSEGLLQAIYFADTCWIESDRNHISIYTENDRINTYLSISEIEAKLPSNQFTRIHKSYIIANHKVVTIDKDSVSIRRQNQLKEIPIGEAYRKPFYQLIDRKIIKRDNK